MSPRHFLDFASGSPLRPEARAAMIDAWELGNADPGRLHYEASAARAALENAREQTALMLHCRPREVVFTSGATESINTVTWGASKRGTNQVISAVEHSAIAVSAARLGEIRIVKVDQTGSLDLAQLGNSIDATTGMVHVQAANHEVGTTQHINDIAEIVHSAGALLHVDAAALIGFEPFDFSQSGADLVSFSGHKWGAPNGTGGFLIRRGLRLEPLHVGSEQERARRAGAENLPALVGLGALAGVSDDESLTAQATRLRALIAKLDRAVESLDVQRYGDPQNRLAHIACYGFADLEPQAVLIGLDKAGVAVHSGSACASEDLEASPTLAAMGVDALRSLRVSLGWSSTEGDVDALVAALPAVLAGLRALRP